MIICLATVSLCTCCYKTVKMLQQILPPSPSLSLPLPTPSPPSLSLCRQYNVSAKWNNSEDTSLTSDPPFSKIMIQAMITITISLPPTPTLSGGGGGSGVDGGGGGGIRGGYFLVNGHKLRHLLLPPPPPLHPRSPPPTPVTYLHTRQLVHLSSRNSQWWPRDIHNCD